MATESDVVLNLGAGGANVRTEQVTTALGKVEQQVVVLADPGGNLAPLPVMDEMLLELKRISGFLQLLCIDYNVNSDPLEVSA